MIMWWAVRIENRPFGPRVESSQFHLMDLVELDRRVRSSQFTVGWGRFVGFCCSVNAEDADAALKIASDAYQTAVGEAIDGPIDSLVCIEGDLLFGEGGSSSMDPVRR